MLHEEIISKIQESKKYRDLSEEIIRQAVEEYIKKNPKWQEYKEKFILKQIKANLHRVYASFQKKGKNKAKELLEVNDLLRLLRTNTSTSERIENYSDIYSEIFEITGKPASIVDLGCGLNPFSLDFMNLKKVKYYAYDVNTRDIDLINQFFKMKNVEGRAELINLRQISSLQKIPEAEVCFMFKVLDVLEEKGHKYSEELLNQLRKKFKFIVVSFATASLGGRKMKYAERGWFERMMQRLHIQFERLDFSNEVFYIVSGLVIN